MIYFYYVLATLFIFLMTSLGAISILFNKKVLNIKHTYNLFIAFAGGVMLAASIFSLLIPSLNYNAQDNLNGMYILFGTIFGALFIFVFDVYLYKKNKKDSKNSKKKMFLAMTLHNIPEGFAVGLTFGLVTDINMCLSSLLFALGIGIQNFPEGLSTALAIYQDENDKKKAIKYGIISGSVEPIASVIGIIFANYLNNFMPFILSFGAGSMLYVVIDELVIKEKKDNKILLNVSFFIGFILMMMLDVLLSF